MNIITRRQWGARPFVRPRTSVPISSRRYFVVHYPGAGTPPADVGDYAKWIERIHIDQNGWSGVGYNYFISHGKIAEGCGRDVIGSHSPPRNRDGIGVNIWTRNGAPLEEDLRLARELYDQLCRQSGRQLIMSYHGKDYATECPGPKLRAWVQAGMPVTGKTPAAGASGATPTTGDDDMPSYTPWTANQKRQAIKPGAWTTLAFSEKDTSFIHEGHDADGYIPELHVLIDGPKLGPDDYVQVRTVRMDAKGKELDVSPVSTFATSEFAYCVPGRAGKDTKVRLQVMPRKASTVTYAGGRSIYWKA